MDDLCDKLARFRTPVYAYFYRRVSDADTAHDLTGETLLRAIEAVRGGNGPHSHLSGWLYRIARNLLIDHYRARERCRLIALDEVDPYLPALVTDTQLEQNVIAAEVRAALESAIAGLTPFQAQVMRARLAGYSFAEIAAALGKSVLATKAHQHRALPHLRRCLERVSEIPL